MAAVLYSEGPEDEKEMKDYDIIQKLRTPPLQIVIPHFSCVTKISEPNITRIPDHELEQE